MISRQNNLELHLVWQTDGQSGGRSVYGSRYYQIFSDAPLRALRARELRY